MKEEIKKEQQEFLEEVEKIDLWFDKELEMKFDTAVPARKIENSLVIRKWPKELSRLIQKKYGMGVSTFLRRLAIAKLMQDGVTFKSPIRFV